MARPGYRRLTPAETELPRLDLPSLRSPSQTTAVEEATFDQHYIDREWIRHSLHVGHDRIVACSGQSKAAVAFQVGALAALQELGQLSRADAVVGSGTGIVVVASLARSWSRHFVTPRVQSGSPSTDLKQRHKRIPKPNWLALTGYDRIKDHTGAWILPPNKQTELKSARAGCMRLPLNEALRTQVVLKALQWCSRSHEWAVWWKRLRRGCFNWTRPYNYEFEPLCIEDFDLRIMNRTVNWADFEPSRGGPLFGAVLQAAEPGEERRECDRDTANRDPAQENITQLWTDPKMHQSRDGVPQPFELDLHRLLALAALPGDLFSSRWLRWDQERHPDTRVKSAISTDPLALQPCWTWFRQRLTQRLLPVSLSDSYDAIRGDSTDDRKQKQSDPTRHAISRCIILLDAYTHSPQYDSAHASLKARIDAQLHTMQSPADEDQTAPRLASCIQCFDPELDAYSTTHRGENWCEDGSSRTGDDNQEERWTDWMRSWFNDTRMASLPPLVARSIANWGYLCAHIRAASDVQWEQFTKSNQLLFPDAQKWSAIHFALEPQEWKNCRPLPWPRPFS